MKKIFVSYDVIGDEIIDAFVRKNDEAAKRDFIQAFRQQSRDDTHVQLFVAYPNGSEMDIPFDNIEGIPVKLVWDSNELEAKHEEAIKD